MKQTTILRSLRLKAFHLIAQGNALGDWHVSLRPVRAKARVGCYALTGRKIVGYGSFPGRCPGL